jgi:MFS family permease
VLLLLSICGFAANLGGRYLDPLITSIARDFVSSTATVALLSSAFTLPFGLSQPFLGPLGYAVGKQIVFKVCFWLLGLALLASALAQSLSHPSPPGYSPVSRMAVSFPCARDAG